MTIVIEKVGHNICATWERQLLLKAWSEDKYSENKLDEFVRRLRAYYKEEIKVVKAN